jgi:hypothetical protein
MLGEWVGGIVCLGTSGAGSQHSRSRLPLVYSYPGFHIVPLTSIPTLRTPRPSRPGMPSGVTFANLYHTTTITTWLIIASFVISCTDAYFYSNHLRSLGTGGCLIPYLLPSMVPFCARDFKHPIAVIFLP